MKSFTDNAGRTWTIEVNVTAIRRVRALVGVNIHQLVDNGLQALGRLVSDPLQLADVLYCLVKDEADARSVSDEEFGRGLAGDVITLAAEAFVEELIDFFPDARVRAGLRQVIDKGNQVRQRLLTHAEAMLEVVDPQVEASRLINSFGNSPASSASTPAPSPSDS